ncbi:hypothetical protein B0H11DRAFT_929166 [Mycena galericulata]|nr:hypothetical protein B0H11DRAFT_929166 [Mycena galericulata]
MLECQVGWLLYFILGSNCGESNASSFNMFESSSRPMLHLNLKLARVAPRGLACMIFFAPPTSARNVILTCSSSPCSSGPFSGSAGSRERASSSVCGE